MTVAHVDFETRSAVDLKKTGAYVYAQDASTDVWCMAYAFDNGPVELWTPDDDLCPPDVAAHIRAGGAMVAHNAAFERVIWRYIMTPRYGWPEPAVDQWRCTMAMAYAMALPGSLDNMLAALGTDQRKDMAGHRLMMTMAKPRRPKKGDTADNTLWWDDEERKQRLFAYCKDDVSGERAGGDRLVRLRPSEQALWHLDQRINDRGVFVDKALCLKAKAIVAQVTAKLDREMAVVTDWDVTACSNIGSLKTWVRARGVDTEALDKEALGELLSRNDLAPNVRRALELRQEAGKASVAKIDALLNGVGAGDRAQGLLQFHAANTGRWAGRRFQPQNIRRPSEDTDVDDAIRLILTYPAPRAAELLEMLYGPPLTVVSDCLRGMIRAAPGNTLYAADFANIEGRVLAWLAGEHSKLDAFRAYDAGTGPDLYKVAAGGIYGVDVKAVSKEQRQIGKVSELACLSGDTRVLTRNGVKTLTNVKEDDLLWDGHEWVTHKGMVSKGRRAVIVLVGLEVTPDHLVLVEGTWFSAAQLASKPDYLARALVTASKSLPSSGTTSGARAGFAPSAWPALVERRNTPSTSAVCAPGGAPGVTSAQRRSPATGSNISGRTRTSCPTTRIDGACLTEYPRASTAAKTPKTVGSITTEAAASEFIRRGSTIDARSLPIWSRLTGGMSRLLRWTASTSTEDTNQATCGSSRTKRTLETREGCATSRSASPPLKPVYDIAFAGPRNRFTVLTDAGPLIVHNCGYQGGVGAFQTMAHTYGVKIADELATTIVQKWRAANPNIKQYWRDLESACYEAVESPGTLTTVRNVKFKVAGSFLWLQLPSGRALCYPYPHIAWKEMPWLDDNDRPVRKQVVAYKGVNSYTRKWETIYTYGGKLAENITQAVARDVMAEAMVRVENAGYPVILTVHDEVVAEPKANFGSVEEFEALMVEMPDWAKGLPVAAEAWRNERYRK